MERDRNGNAHSWAARPQMNFTVALTHTHLCLGDTVFAIRRQKQFAMEQEILA